MKPYVDGLLTGAVASLSIEDVGEMGHQAEELSGVTTKVSVSL